MAWTVAALLLAVADALAARFSAVAVRGELSGFTRASSGHCYFSLKDGDGSGAALRCVMFRRQAVLLQSLPRDGQQVEVRGRLSVYEPRGELQLVVESLQPVGAGRLYEEFLRLKARLEQAGWFDPLRKRALPAHPQVVGVVTSSSGAVWHDVMTTLRRRAPHVRVILYPSIVQGGDAPASLRGALALANARAEADVILLCRGGGSLEDLWAFNDEQLVMAVAQSSIPIVSGVGHETDVTLTDWAADLRAPTPTAAAELVSPARDDLLQMLAVRAQAMIRRVHQRLDDAEQRLDLAGLRLRDPRRALQSQGDRLRMAQQRLSGALQGERQRLDRQFADRQQRWQRVVERTLLGASHDLGLREARLRAADPRGVLSRGYAWIEGSDGRPVVSAASLVVGEGVRAVWADGVAQAHVTAVDLVPSGPPVPPRPTRG
ncbi:exodeoxyribonuclease VII large subunit [Ideonella oryzae]|uniref:Exodeoxyribonuclease 7 large subunit n=1 Tax=Ideonella oryzae TaxID=2937441 RepID=A0ABT1BUX9_9BURK|nr:exodeoxyribonuclease VII large subunit [Ideonella oryzae]MCO5979197.1 exodeoxyribonuclease VII large subunit [Ideonella oryzae]